VTYTGSTAQADNYKAGGNFKTTTATGNVGQNLPLNEVGSSAYESRNQMLSFALKGGNHLVEAKLGFQDIPQQLYPNQRMDMLDNEQKTFNLRYLGQYDWGLFEARAYYEKVDPHYMDFGPDKRFWYGMASGGMMGDGKPCSPISANCAAGMPMYTKSSNTGVNVKADVNLDAQNLLRVGGLYQHYTLDDWWPPSGAAMWPGTFDNINDGTRDRFGLFGEWEARLNAQWLTLLGARYERVKTDAGNVQGYDPTTNGMGMMVNDQKKDAAAFNAQSHERTDNNWDLTALARYTPDANSDIEFGVARKVRSPNLYERYTWSTWSMAAVMNNFVGDGNGYYGNINLKPEQAHTVSPPSTCMPPTALGTPHHALLHKGHRLHRCHSLSGRCLLHAGQPDGDQPVRRSPVRQPVGRALRPRCLRAHAARLDRGRRFRPQGFAYLYPRQES
jgi:iron complex outermembrane receptor protein